PGRDRHPPAPYPDRASGGRRPTVELRAVRRCRRRAARRLSRRRGGPAMTIREERLSHEMSLMNELRQRCKMIDFVARCQPLVEYIVTLRCLGMIAADRTGSEHVARIYLHVDYPRRPPEVTVLTPCFHPNIAAPFQMPPFQALVREALDRTPDEEEKRRIEE